MSRKITFLILVFFISSVVSAEQLYSRLLFVGDILLSRNVTKEIDQKKESPWQKIKYFFQPADYIVGNLEGAVGSSSECAKNRDPNLCFFIEKNRLNLLKEIGFHALSIENNHSEDLGSAGKKASKKQLDNLDIDALTFEDSPWFIKVNNMTIAMVAYSSIANGQSISSFAPNLKLAQKIRLAKQLSNVVVVYIHWGNELQDWPSKNQRQFAKWLVSQGADLIVGHHPHVIQAAECIDSKPVIFSLGNHVFDQKYPLTKIGQMLVCTPSVANFKCEFKKTFIGKASAFPEIITEDASSQNFWRSCGVTPHAMMTLSQYAISPELKDRAVSAKTMKIEIQSRELKNKTTSTRASSPQHNANLALSAHSLLWLTAVKLKGPNDAPLLLTLQTQFSPIDKEKSPRPYVYDIGPHGLIAKWRGSALAWPLLDITVVHDKGFDYLCALHRGDSFLMLDPNNKQTRIQAYRWNGFGFSASAVPAVKKQCEDYYREMGTIG